MDQIVRYYDQLANDYDESRFGNSYGQFIDRQERRILVKILNGCDGIILDLACGSGRLLDFATIGADGSNHMVKIAKEKFPAKRIVCCDAGALPFEDESIDAIITFHVFMHLEKRKITDIICECYRVLKPGGKLIFDIPSKKRRKLFSYRKDGWHGATNLSVKDIRQLTLGRFILRRSFGLLLFPIHRLPKKMRRFFARLDYWGSNSLLKEYSSYIVFECTK